MIEHSKLDFLFNISIIIAIAFAICFYNNQTGIACAVFGIFIVSLFWWLIKEKKKKKIGFWHLAYGLCCMLLCFVPAVSDNSFIIVVSKLLYLITQIKWTIHIYYNVEQLTFIRNISILIDFIFAVISQVFAPFTDIRRRGKADNCRMNDGMVDSETGLMKKEQMIRQSYRKQIFIGVIISFPVLVIVLCLLASADVVFRNIIVSVFNGADNIVVMIKWLLTALVGFVIAYASGRSLLINRIKIFDVEIKKADTVIGITFAGIFSAVYLLFCGVQIAALLTGGNMLPAGYTYARYARTGFFQLMVVCIINVCMVIACRLKFNMSSILKKLLTVISACTYVMVVSSAYRVILYIQNYNLSFLRVLSLWVLVVIAVLMVFVIWFIYDSDIKLFEYALLSVTALFLIFAFIRPDNIIAEYNIRNFENESNSDLSYLTNHLSMDAAGAIISNESGLEYPAEDKIVKYCENIVSEYESRYKNDIRKFNYSRYQAYKQAKEFLRNQYRR